jgi:beta-lactamase class A
LAAGLAIPGSRFTVQYCNIAAADVAKTFWIAPAACKIKSAYERHVTVAGQAGVLTLEKLTSGEAPGAGDELIAAGWDLTSTANTPVSKTAVTTAAGTFAAGDALALKVQSGNAASYALVRTFGGWDRVVSAASDLGMADTTRDDTDTFVTTPKDMLIFLLALTERKLVSPEASDSMLLLLARQPNNDRIPAELPDGVLVAHKTGELPGVRNDVGVVFAPGGRYVICVFGAGDEETSGELSTTIAHVSRLVYDRYAETPGANAGSAGQSDPR